MLPCGGMRKFARVVIRRKRLNNTLLNEYADG